MDPNQPFTVDESLYPPLDVGLDGLIDIPAAATKQIKSDWGPEALSAIQQAYRFPVSIKNATTQRAIAVRFLQFYGTGEVPNTHEPEDVVLAMASLVFSDKAAESQHLVWPASGYTASSTENLIFRVDGDPLVVTVEDENIPTGEDLVVIRLDSIKDLITEENIDVGTTSELPVLRLEDDIGRLSKKVAPLLYGYVDGALKVFMRECEKILNEIKPQRGVTQSQINLYRLLNFLALTTMRSVCKSSAQMKTSFMKTNYKNNVEKMFSGVPSRLYAPPCKKYVELSSSSIDKSWPAQASFIAHCVSLYVSLGATKSPLKGMLGAAFLVHCSWNGMGILHMIWEISDGYNTSWKDIMRLTALSSTHFSWTEIKSFFSQYQKASAPDDSVAWARIIDDAYFTRYRCTNHAALASLLLRSQANLQEDSSDITLSVWASTHIETVDRYREASEHVMKTLLGTSDDVHATHKMASKTAQLAQQAMHPTTEPLLVTPAPAANRIDPTQM